MPGTARHFGVRDPLDPYQNVLGGARFLRHLMDRYAGQLPDVVAAYLRGEGRFDGLAGEPLHPNTLGYIRRVLTARDEVNATVSAGEAGKGPAHEPALTGDERRSHVVPEAR